jgi:hypothetical protein
MILGRWYCSNFLILNFRRRALGHRLNSGLKWDGQALTLVFIDPAVLVALYNEFSCRMANFESFCSLINA